MNIVNKAFRKILVILSGNNFHLKRFLYDQDLELFVHANSTANSRMGKYVVINPPYKIHDSQIGNYTYVSENAVMQQTVIGKFCSIGPNFKSGHGVHPASALSTSPMFYSTAKQNGITFSKTDKISERKPITIGNDVFIGMNVTILDGITVGDGSIIGAGAVISKDIPPYSIAVGCPIQVTRKRFTEEQIEALLHIKWWDFDEAKLKDVEKMIFDVDAFLTKYSTAVSSGY